MQFTFELRRRPENPPRTSPARPAFDAPPLPRVPTVWAPIFRPATRRGRFVSGRQRRPPVFRIERAGEPLERRLAPRERFPALDDHVAIERIELHHLYRAFPGRD